MTEEPEEIDFIIPDKKAIEIAKKLGSKFTALLNIKDEDVTQDDKETKDNEDEA